MKIFLNKVLTKLRVFSRFRRSYAYSGFSFLRILKWSFQHTEFSNYYYSITSRNLKHINSVISMLTRIEYNQVSSYSDEILNNTYLKQHFNSFCENHKNMRHSTLEIGRRVLWYTLIRATKPRLVVETGVSHGVGSCVIAQALIQNKLDGFPGFAIGTEIEPNGGSLIVSPWSETYTVEYGDSLNTLNNLNQTVDIFISDSDHDSVYEYKEYQTIFEKMSENGIMLGDNAHATDSLLNFSIQNKRSFVFITEKPLNHWYPGGGVGISIKNNSVFKFQ